jgi:epoxyqueuosine reductase
MHEVINLSSKDWEELSEESFKEIFKESPIKRSKFAGIQRNLKFLSSTN